MKITFIIAVFPPEGDPSAVMGKELVEGLRAAGHSVSVICPFPNRPGGELYEGYKRSLRQVEKQRNGRLVRVWTWLIGPERHHYNRVMENISLGISATAALLIEERPDVLLVEAWPILSLIPILAVANSLDIPVVNYIKDIYPEAAVSAGIIEEGSIIDRSLFTLDRWIMRSCQKNICISDGMRQYLLTSRGLDENKLEVVCDWLDLETIRPFQGENRWRQRVGLPERAFLCLFAGTMGHASGVDILVEVAERLANHAGIHLVCVGEGVHKERMAAEIRRKGLRNITLLPFQPREEVAEMQSSADLLMLITAPNMGSSSVPSKMITYMAVGRPLLCAIGEDSEIARIVVGHGIGRVVSPGTSDSIANGILEVQSISVEERQRMGERGRKVAIEKHSLKCAVRQFDRVFHETIDEA